MRRSRNILAAISVLALILTACGKSAAPIRVYSGLGPNWYNADLSTLPFADDPGAMAEVALILSQRNAVEGQKYYAFKLAEMAFARSDERRIALAYSRAAYLLAEIEPDEDRMVEIAEKGLAAAEKAGTANKDPEANFYYALNLGLVLKTKGLFALGRLPKLQETLKIAMEKPEQDMGGPLRVLGMLYLSAPEWPQGIGDLEKSLELLEQASTNYPAHPQNHIFYAKALIEDDDPESASAVLQKAEKSAVEEIWGTYYFRQWNEEIKALQRKIQKQ